MDMVSEAFEKPTALASRTLCEGCAAAHFTSRLYQQLGEDAVLPNLEEFEKIIGYNKIILLWKSGKYAIANEKGGAWIDDDTIWVSNMPGKYRCKK